MAAQTEHDFFYERVDPNLKLMLPFSSGTTGNPKGVGLSARNLLANALQVSHVEPEGDNFLGLVPFFHIYGMMLIHLSILQGKSIVVLPRFLPDTFLEALTTYKVRSTLRWGLWSSANCSASAVDPHGPHRAACGALPGAPPAGGAVRPLLDGVRRVWRRPDRQAGREPRARPAGPARQADLRHDRALARSQLWRRPHAQAGGTRCASSIGRGGADCGGCCVLQGSAGRLVPNTELRVRCMSTDRDLPPNQEGELLYRGPQVMLGYENNHEANQSIFTEDGFLRTGDIGYIDDDGFVFVIDRAKELIKYKGHQVAPGELEDVLNHHPAIADCCCVRGQDALGQEIPKAFVVLKNPDSPHRPTPQDIISYVAEHVAPFKKVREVQFIDAIPKNASGKMLRRHLQERENRLHNA